MVCRHHAATLYIKRLIDYIYPRVMTQVNVSATVGMSAIVGENVHNSGGMSSTVGGNVRDSGGN